MPAKNLHREKGEGIYSHIYNKGVEKRLIFNDEEDYEVFKGFLNDYLTAPQDPESTKKDFTVHGRVFRGTPHQPKNYCNEVELIAYSLVPDHFHLVLHQQASGSVINFIRSLSTRYSIYFNKKYHRTGTLFEGPYKSVTIPDDQHLLHLTRYVHQTKNHSSYPEYLGVRETTWVKPKIVFSFFGQAVDRYKEFVEKFELNQNEKELLKGITLEEATPHLERSSSTDNVEEHLPVVATKPPEEKPLKENLKPHQRLAEFLAATAIFALLLAIAVTNIMIFQTNRSESLTLGVATSIFSLPSGLSSPFKTEVASATASPALSPTPSPVAEEKISTASAEAVTTTMLVVNLDDGARSVNIRQKPTTDSPKIGKAKNGDTFEMVSQDSGWYEIKLDENSTGFITEKSVKTGDLTTNE